MTLKKEVEKVKEDIEAIKGILKDIVKYQQDYVERLKELEKKK